MNTNGRITNPRTVLVLASALSVWMAAGAAGARAEFGLRPSAEQTALAHDTCANVMRIGQGVVPFDACVDSLTETLGNRTQSEMLARSSRDCIAAGHGQETEELAICMLDRKAAHTAQWNKTQADTAPERVTVNYMRNRPGQVGYSLSTPQERRRREEYSCARLGMIPGSARFGQCVAELDISLRSAEIPNAS